MRAILAILVLATIARGQVIPPDFVGKVPADDRELPAFIKPGLRISWETGEAKLQGAKLEPHEHGSIVDKQGNRYILKGRQNNGGVGITQFNIVAASPRAIASDTQLFLFVDEKNTPTLSFERGLVSDGINHGDVWIHPARLAAMKSDEILTLRRGMIVYRGQRFDTVTLRSSAAGTFFIRVYDAASGLLLTGGASNIEPDVTIINKDGSIETHQQGGIIKHSLLLGVRQAPSPWASAAAPQWAAAGEKIEHAGTMRDIIETFGQPPLPPRPLGVSFRLDRMVEGAAVCTLTTMLADPLNVAPYTSETVRCYGSALTYGLWAAPDVLAKIKPNTVIDEDRLTGYRTVFQGVQGNSALLMIQGPLDSRESAYDMRSGMLTAVRNTKLIPASGGKQVVEFSFRGTRR